MLYYLWIGSERIARNVVDKEEGIHFICRVRSAKYGQQQVEKDTVLNPIRKVLLLHGRYEEEGWRVDCVSAQDLHECQYEEVKDGAGGVQGMPRRSRKWRSPFGLEEEV